MTYYSKYWTRKAISDDGDIATEDIDNDETTPMQRDDFSRVREYDEISLSHLIQLSVEYFSFYVNNPQSMTISTTQSNPTTIDVILLADVLYQLKEIDGDLFINLICNAIESYPPSQRYMHSIGQSKGSDTGRPRADPFGWNRGQKDGKKETSYQYVEGDVYSYDYCVIVCYLWRRLGEICGSVPIEKRITRIDQPIDPCSEVYRYIYSNNALANDFSKINEKMRSQDYERVGKHLHRMDIPIGNRITIESPSSPNILSGYDKIQTLRTHRQWWSGSILNPFAMGPFKSIITESTHMEDITMRIKAVQSSDISNTDTNPNDRSTLLQLMNDLLVHGVSSDLFYEGRDSSSEEPKNSPSMSADNGSTKGSSIRQSESHSPSSSSASVSSHVSGDHSRNATSLRSNDSSHSISMNANSLNHARSTSINITSIAKEITLCKTLSDSMEPSECLKHKSSCASFCGMKEHIFESDSHGSNRSIMLGYGVLYELSWKVLINTLIYSQDSLFTILGVQILLENYSIYRRIGQNTLSQRILQHLSFLSQSGINIERVIRLGVMLYAKDVTNYDSYHTELHSAVIDGNHVQYIGDPRAFMYNPV